MRKRGSACLKDHVTAVECHAENRVCLSVNPWRTTRLKEGSPKFYAGQVSKNDNIAKEHPTLAFYSGLARALACYSDDLRASTIRLSPSLPYLQIPSSRCGVYFQKKRLHKRLSDGSYVMKVVLNNKPPTTNVQAFDADVDADAPKPKPGVGKGSFTVDVRLDRHLRIYDIVLVTGLQVETSYKNNKNTIISGLMEAENELVNKHLYLTKLNVEDLHGRAAFTGLKSLPGERNVPVELTANIPP